MMLEYLPYAAAAAGGLLLGVLGTLIAIKESLRKVMWNLIGWVIIIAFVVVVVGGIGYFLWYCATHTVTTTPEQYQALQKLRDNLPKDYELVRKVGKLQKSYLEALKKPEDRLTLSRAMCELLAAQRQVLSSHDALLGRASAGTATMETFDELFNPDFLTPSGPGLLADEFTNWATLRQARAQQLKEIEELALDVKDWLPQIEDPLEKVHAPLVKADAERETITQVIGSLSECADLYIKVRAAGAKDEALNALAAKYAELWQKGTEHRTALAKALSEYLAGSRALEAALQTTLKTATAEESSELKGTHALLCSCRLRNQVVRTLTETELTAFLKGTGQFPDAQIAAKYAPMLAAEEKLGSQNARAEIERLKREELVRTARQALEEKAKSSEKK